MNGRYFPPSLTARPEDPRFVVGYVDEGYNPDWSLFALFLVQSDAEEFLAHIRAQTSDVYNYSLWVVDHEGTYRRLNR